MNNVFISYSRKDQALAEEIRKFLCEKGVSCWMDRYEILGSDDFADSISKSIEECPVFLMILSQSSQESDWVYKELYMATKMKKKVIPFLIDNKMPEGKMDYLIGPTNIINISPDKNSAIELLWNTIYNEIGDQINEIKEESFEEEKYDSAKCFFNMAVNYRNDFELLKSHDYFVKAASILRELYAYNPKKYSADLAACLSNQGSLYIFSGDDFVNDFNAEKSQYILIEAADLYEHPYQTEPDKYASALINCLVYLSEIYIEKDKLQEAEAVLNKTLQILEGIPKKADSEPLYAEVYFYIALLLLKKGDNNFLGYLNKSRELKETIINANPDIYDLELFDIYSIIGNIKCQFKEYQHALEFHKKALSYCSKRAEVSPLHYNESYAICNLNLAFDYCYLKKKNECRHAFSATIEVLQYLCKKSPRRYSPLLAYTYYKCGESLKDKHLKKQGKELAKKYPENKFCKSILGT